MKPTINAYMINYRRMMKVIYGMGVFLFSLWGLLILFGKKILSINHDWGTLLLMSIIGSLVSIFLPTVVLGQDRYKSHTFYGDECGMWGILSLPICGSLALTSLLIFACIFSPTRELKPDTSLTIVLVFSSFILTYFVKRDIIKFNRPGVPAQPGLRECVVNNAEKYEGSVEVNKKTNRYSRMLSNLSSAEK